MLRISLQTLPARRASLAGAFLAVLLAVTFAYASGLLMAGALADPGPGRLAAADLVVRADPTVDLGADTTEDVTPAPPLPARLVSEAAGVEGVAAAIGDTSFPVGIAADAATGHAWSAAALTPYRLQTGRAPRSADEVVVETGSAARVGSEVTVTAAGDERRVRVVGEARPGTADDGEQTAVFFTDGAAAALSGRPGAVTAIGVQLEPGASAQAVRTRLEDDLGPRVEVLEHGRAAYADAGDPREAGRPAVIAIFATMGGIAGAIALFVVSGTFALALAQRRKETAVLRALGASPRQVGRLVAGEALLVSLVAGGIGLLLGRPLANAIVDQLERHGTLAGGLDLGPALVPAAAALALGVGLAQLAVLAAARRAGRTKPAEALREVAIEHGRPSAVQLLCGIACLGGGVAMALAFDGKLAGAFSILTGLLLAMGIGLLGRPLLGLPAALLALPLRRVGPAGLLAGTSLAANRWRTAALATPILLVAMMAGTQAIVAATDQRNVEDVTAARVTAAHVVVGADAPLTAGTSEAIAGLDGIEAVTATVPADVYGLGQGLGEDSPWPASGVTAPDAALDLDVLAGSLDRVHGDAIGVSRVFAETGSLRVGDRIEVELGDRTEHRLEVAAIYERASGLGDVVLDPATARAHTPVPADDAVFVDGDDAALSGYAADHPAVRVLDRRAYLDSLEADGARDRWGIWMIIVLAAGFAALALVNTAAMSTGERRDELATLRLLGATRGHAVRMVLLEMAPTMVVALAAGAIVVGAALVGVPQGITGIPLAVPFGLVAGLTGALIALGLLASVVSTRIALRASPLAAMRVRD